jgi:predicted metal-dependent hydrolase
MKMKKRIKSIKTDTFELNGNKYLVKIHYENRSNSTVSIGKRAIHIRIPSSLSREDRLKQLMKMKMWAINKLKENPNLLRKEVQREYNDGDILKVGDKEFILNIDYKSKKGSSGKLIDDRIYLSISNNLSKEEKNKHISVLLSRCIASIRLPILKEKVESLNQKYFNQKINNIFFKYNKSNWGSCSGSGNINISTRLVFAPEEVLDYVCIHEIAHLIEPNHSKRFWELVERAMPSYREKEKWLNENGNKCNF